MFAVWRHFNEGHSAVQGCLRSLQFVRMKQIIDTSRIPQLLEEDLEEQFVKGSGPGGQSVNKTVNCVVLIHKPTGLIVKCHESRLQSKNRQLARQLMITKLDNFKNGDDSVESQKARLSDKKSSEKQRRQKKLTQLKLDWKKREGIK